MSQVVVRLLPDKSGRVRIHWFARDAQGPAQTPPSKHPVFASLPGDHPMKPGARGYIACQKNRSSVTPQMANGVWEACPHTDDPRAATCPQCQDTPEFKKAMQDLEEIVPNPAS